ncbi:MAG: hypothetical protein JW719_13995 [Pirellulales bacterium]|nr:hypothetical protein [Pirellulales bacterium]
MRVLYLCFILLAGIVALSTGCSRSDNSSKPDPAASSPSGGWASNEKNPAAETLPPPADPFSDADKSAASMPLPPVLPPPEEPAQEEAVDRDAPAPAETEPATEPPADAFAPPLAPAPSEPPALRNPLRETPPPDAAEASNPMRRPQAPLPDSEEPNAARPMEQPSGDRSSQGESSVFPQPPPTAPPDATKTDAPGGEHAPEASPSPPAAETPVVKAEETETEKEPFDPIKENGPIFVGWPRPKLSLVITGREDGYIEPCGCAGLDRMKGGLSRRHAMIESLRKQGWPVVCVDAGGLSKGYGPQAEIKFQRTVDAMRKMGYDAIGLGINDLQLPTAELVSVAAEPSPFVSANVGLFGLDAGVTAKTKIVEVGGLKVGVTAVLGKSYHNLLANNPEIELASPEDAIAQVLPALKKNCNLLVLLAFATKEESIALGKEFPDFQLVVTSGGPPEPPREPLQIPDTQSLLIEMGEKGMNAVVLGLYDDPAKPLRYQRVPLDSRFAASKAMYRIMVAYQEELKRLGLEGLGIRPVSHPQSDVNGPFVGSERCKSCHEESYRVWKKSGHAKAWQTLVEGDPPRNFDPECISCHVIGWHPTKHFPYKTGFLSAKKTPEMLDVGCESCHGPGGAHCDAEDGSDLALQEKLYEAVRVTKEESQTNLSKMCQNCHDLDNSPDFNFETYWPKVEHYEEE